jgi:hypothetical protein
LPLITSVLYGGGLMSEEPKSITARVEREILAFRMDLITARDALHRALKFNLDGAIERAQNRVKWTEKALGQAIAPYESLKTPPTIPSNSVAKKWDRLMNSHKLIVACHETLNESPLDDPCFLDEVRETPEWEGIEGAL